MSEPNTSLSFRIFQDDVLVREETLEAAVIKIGKLSSSHLRLDDDSVSRMHAVIEVSNSKVSIIDLGSTVGTRVNGKKINKATLHDGDTLIIGEMRVELAIAAHPVVESAPKVSQAAPPPLPQPMAHAPLSVAPAIAAAPASGASAIEVTAMLGDSVVGVKHVMNPRGGHVTKTTYGLFAGGALLLLLSSIAFFSGVGTAADNKARFHEHVAAKKVAHEFRPARLGAAFDWMALGGLAGGLICMTFGLLRLRDERVTPRFRIGNAPGVDLPTSDSPLEDFSLVAPDGDSFVFNFAEGWEGHFSHQGQVTSLADLAAGGGAHRSASIPGAWQVAIPANANIQVRAGSQDFSVRSVAEPRRQATPLWMRGSSEMYAYLGATAIVVIGFVLMLGGLQPDERTMAGDSFDGSLRMAHLQTTPLEDAITEPEPDKGSDEAAGGTGTKMAGDSGKMGTKEASRDKGQFSQKKNSDLPPSLARDMATTQASEAGILGVWKTQDGGAFHTLTSSFNVSNGIDDRDVYGGLTGSEVAAAAGGWGYGLDGIGPGAGGTGWETIGTGKIGVIGHSEGTGSGYMSGTGKGDLRRHKATSPKVVIGDARKNGDLDREIIRRHVRRKLSRIKYCYEKQLVVSPSLSGTVVTSFQISPAGKVQGASARGIGNSNVESCVADAIESIQFPKPKDGGYVNVTSYPFTFQPAG